MAILMATTTTPASSGSQHRNPHGAQQLPRHNLREDVQRCMLYGVYGVYGCMAVWLYALYALYTLYILTGEPGQGVSAVQRVSIQESIQPQPTPTWLLGHGCRGIRSVAHELVTGLCL